VPTYLVSKLAREDVKVALSADGGDELFWGYSHYSVVLDRHAALARWPRAAREAFSRSLGSLDRAALCRLADRLPLPARLRHGTRRALLERLAKLAVMMPRLEAGSVYDLAMSFWTPWEISELLGGGTTARERVAGPGPVADQMVHSDLRYYLPDDILVKVDRTTMAAGLEGREPMLDHRLVELAVRLPLAMRRGPLGAKHLLRKILYRHVPRELLERPKQGFAIPLARWLRTELSPLVDEYLAPGRIRAGGLLDPEAVGRAVANFREGGPGNDRLDVKKVWLLLAFEMWRSRWDTGYERRAEDVIHARAVHH
jgi:asparagine synthase (glutamine-hydrolysing)